MSEHWVKLHTKIKDWEWYKNPNTFRVFIHCILSANIVKGKFEGETIKVGEFVSSIRKIAKELGITERHTRTALNHLKATQCLTIKTTHRFSIIKVLNWGNYQSMVLQNDTVNDTVNDIQTTQRKKKNDNNNRYNTNTIYNNKDLKNKEIKENSIINTTKEKKKNTVNELSELEKTIIEFKKFRKSIKSAMTERAETLLRNKLNDLAETDEEKIKILEQSIMNGWKSVFPIQKSRNGFNKKEKPDVSKPKWLDEFN